MSDDKDIRLDPYVIKTYWAMRGYPIPECRVLDFVSNAVKYAPIPMSVGDLAFWMRDKCVDVLWFSHLQINIGGWHDAEDTIKKSTPEQWIKAACKAWNSKAADAAEQAND